MPNQKIQTQNLHFNNTRSHVQKSDFDCILESLSQAVEIANGQRVAARVSTGEIMLNTEQ